MPTNTWQIEPVSRLPLGLGELPPATTAGAGWPESLRSFIRDAAALSLPRAATEIELGEGGPAGSGMGPLADAERSRQSRLTKALARGMKAKKRHEVSASPAS